MGCDKQGRYQARHSVHIPHTCSQFLPGDDSRSRTHTLQRCPENISAKTNWLKSIDGIDLPASHKCPHTWASDFPIKFQEDHVLRHLKRKWLGSGWKVAGKWLESGCQVDTRCEDTLIMTYYYFKAAFAGGRRTSAHFGISEASE